MCCCFSLSCLVLSCFFRVHPLGGLFLAHAEAGLHCTVQSITPPWAGCLGLVHLNQSRGVVRLLHMYCPSSYLPAKGNLTSCLSTRFAIMRALDKIKANRRDTEKLPPELASTISKCYIACCLQITETYKSQTMGQAFYFPLIESASANHEHSWPMKQTRLAPFRRPQLNLFHLAYTDSRTPQFPVHA